jgi:protein-S-isoprenylcysteine O-methyltransferase Ste14
MVSCYFMAMLKIIDYQFFVDRSEQLIFSCLYVYFLTGFVSSSYSDLDIINYLYLVDQTLILLFLITRRVATEISLKPKDYLIAVAGTLSPLIATPSTGHNIFPESGCVFLMLIGIFIHLSAKLTLRRSFGIIPADRGIKASGPYLFVRHPMYLGYILVHISFILSGPNLWNCALFVITWGFYILRIEAEERLLTQNDHYLAFQNMTHFRLIPGIY